MNERIKQLAQQAGMVPGGYANTPDKIMTWRESFDNPGSLEKFAELIIEECEKVILAKLAVTDIDGEAERAWEMGMECGVYTIKEHFGVQE